MAQIESHRQHLNKTYHFQCQHDHKDNQINNVSSNTGLLLKNNHHSLFKITHKNTSRVTRKSNIITMSLTIRSTRLVLY